MIYFIRYGLNNQTIDITNQVIQESIMISKYIYIPPMDDVKRGAHYGDPCYGAGKIIYLVTDKGHLFTIMDGEYAYIDQAGETLYINEKPDDIDKTLYINETPDDIGKTLYINEKPDDIE